MPEQNSAVYDALSRISFFEKLSTVELHKIAKAVTLHEVSRGSTMNRNGELSGTQFVVEGYAYVWTQPNTIIEFVGPGDYFGNAIGTNVNPFQYLKAVTQFWYINVPRSIMALLLRQHPDINESIITCIEKRYHRIAQRMAYMKHDIQTRVRYAVLTLIDDFGVNHPKGKVVPFRLSGQELADYCAASRENANRGLNRMWEAGHIDLTTGEIILLGSACRD